MGADWGEDGYIRMERNVADTKYGLCGIAKAAIYPIKKSPNRIYTSSTTRLDKIHMFLIILGIPQYYFLVGKITEGRIQDFTGGILWAFVAFDGASITSQWLPQKAVWWPKTKRGCKSDSCVRWSNGVLLRDAMTRAPIVRFGFAKRVADLKLKPHYSTPGGYSCKAVHPIALAKVMNIAQMMKSECDDKHYYLSGIGGVEWSGDW
ncbi:hypothetical protein IFM89_024103 [Coptis chinensis]|uniref:Uncharacterized protein n=1 Tax=Coptis chinensis TaxID=261450 RepID=A0A835HGP0_9MAGN|nr:hypothetical protein IFM89_024103 [Coptis chinensis]